MKRLLLLGGTTEASALAAALADDVRFATILSFAGATRAPRLPLVPYRVGGFGGIAGLVDFLRAERMDLLLDATHPFAAGMKANAAAAAAIAGIPALGVLRPAWQPRPGDAWTTVADMAAAANALGTVPRRVLLTIGQKDLAAFGRAPWHSYVIRSIDPPTTPPPNARIITARGPFNEADELALLAGHRIEALVTKNSGGAATVAKLAAARRLGVAVVMVARPSRPEMATVDDVPGAWDWLHQHAVRGA
jgi:precorrin-6A/cobalt-precorrin-6A reductase